MASFAHFCLSNLSSQPFNFPKYTTYIRFIFFLSLSFSFRCGFFIAFMTPHCSLYVCILTICMDMALCVCIMLMKFRRFVCTLFFLFFSIYNGLCWLALDMHGFLFSTPLSWNVYTNRFNSLSISISLCAFKIHWVSSKQIQISNKRCIGTIILITNTNFNSFFFKMPTE